MANLFGEPDTVEAKRPRRLHQYPKVEREMPHTCDWTAKHEDQAELALLDRLQPRKRGDCAAARAAVYADLDDDDPVKAIAPCPWMRCKHHLHVDVTPIVWRGHDADEVAYHEDAPIQWTCALDAVEALQGIAAEPAADDDAVDDALEDARKVAAPDETHAGLMTDAAIGEMLGVSDEWIRQTWRRALAKIKPKLGRLR